LPRSLPQAAQEQIRELITQVAQTATIAQVIVTATATITAADNSGITFLQKNGRSLQRPPLKEVMKNYEKSSYFIF
jgi:hypothetical protein